MPHPSRGLLAIALVSWLGCSDDPTSTPPGPDAAGSASAGPSGASGAGHAGSPGGNGGHSPSAGAGGQPAGGKSGQGGSSAGGQAASAGTSGQGGAGGAAGSASSGGQAGSAGCPPWPVAGTARELLTAIVEAMKQQAGPGSNAMKLPEAQERDAFATLVAAALAGDDAAACALPPSYRLLTLADPAGALRVVAEVDAQGSPAPALFWGTYAAPAGQFMRDLAVEAPHPLFDTNTWREAVDLFTETHARWLLVAGAHRCSADDESPCSGTTTACGASGPFRVSDTAHAVASPFWAVHHAVAGPGSPTTTLQLHGNDDSDCPAALVSDSSGAWGQSALALALADALDAASVDVGRCGQGFPTPACNLCGETNVEARDSAGSLDACTKKGAAYGGFVHLEQGKALRQTPAPGVSGYGVVIDALLSALPSSG